MKLKPILSGPGSVFSGLTERLRQRIKAAAAERLENEHRDRRDRTTVPVVRNSRDEAR